MHVRRQDDYQDEFLAAHADASSFERVLAESRRERVLDFLKGAAGQKVLEVGCGTHPLFLDAPDIEFTVVEAAPALAAAALQSAAGHPNVQIIEGYLEDAVARLKSPRPFDVVVASSVLHEVPDPRLLLASLRAVCGLNTQVWINVPNVRSLHRLLALEMGLISDLFEPSATELRFQRHSRFDQASLASLVVEEGFTVQSMKTAFAKPFTNQQMEALLPRLPGNVVEGLERLANHIPGLGAEIDAVLRAATSHPTRNATTKPGA